jgi:cysteine desulfurase / selenocysteine lyase
MIYLDCAATSMPKPRIVAKAVATAIERFGNPGRSGHAASLEAGRAIYECREELCGLFNGKDPLRFVFCSNCTDALNQAIKGMLPEGGHVVTTALEHNSVLRPLHTLKERQMISLSIVYPKADGYVLPDDIMREINPRTRLVVVNHASNVTGAVQPVKEIAALCYRRGVPLLVDGAQSAGCLPIDLSQVGMDLFAFPGHKGLLGPQGSGALYIRESCAPLPLREGGTGSMSLLLTQPMDMPDRYESGTPATPAIAGLLAGTHYVRENLNGIIAAEARLTNELWEGLKGIEGVALYGPPPSKPRVGVIAFNIGDQDASSVADKLSEEYGIACRAGLHCAPLAHRFLGTENRGALRFSLGPFNTSEEIRAAIKAVYQISKKGL